MKDFLAPVIKSEHRIIKKCRILIFCFCSFIEGFLDQWIRIYPLAKLNPEPNPDTDDKLSRMKY
jgi:hypothetical protein